MANVAFVDINPADEEQFFKGLNPQSQFLYSRMRKKTTLFSAKKTHAISARSLLPAISALWSALSPTEKALWTTTGAYSGLNGWRSFVAEQSIRMKLGLSVPNTPVTSHQAWVGHLFIGGSAEQIQIAQYHPSSYWVRHKVTGKKGLYAPVLVSETMSLPLQIGISYKANLTSVGGSQYIKYYAVVRSSYQGVDRENVVEINCTNDNAWHIATATLSETLGYIIGYTLYIHIFGYTGDFFFDNVKAIHGAVNWVRDKNCSNIKATFSNQYYQIPNHWVALEIPSGAVYDSDYVD